MKNTTTTDFSLDKLRHLLHPFCEKYKLKRLEVFGSAAREEMDPRSDIDLLATLDESLNTPTDEILEMAGEVEEILGVPVDFVLRHSLEKSTNHYARDHILKTAVRIYGE